MWVHPDDSSVFVTLRSHEYDPLANELGFYPYFEPPVPKVFFYPSTCPHCGKALKAIQYPSDINAEYVIICPECNRNIIKKEIPDADTVDKIKREREAEARPGNKTIMMQILGKNPEEAEARIAYFLNPGSRYGFPEAPKTGGAVYPFDECKDILTDIHAYYDLWTACFYPGFRELHMIDTNQPVYVLRFTTKQNDRIGIPYSYLYGGDLNPALPYDGSGYVNIPNGKIPVYQYNDDVKISGGAIFRIDPNGKEHTVAAFNFFSRKFILV